MTPLAHVGHWLVETLYVAPVLAVVGVDLGAGDPRPTR